MDQIRERLNTRSQQMDRELGLANPDGKRMAEHARAVEREMKQWQRQHREMGKEMGIQP